MTKLHLTINGETLIGNFFDNGAYGDLFKVHDGKRLLKIFRSRENKYENFIAENACRSEILAYRKLMSSDDLSSKAPRFFGSTNVECVRQEGDDISGKYLLSSAYCIEFIDKAFKKISLDTESKNEIRKFREIGVNYIEDADFCIAETGFIFIDFAVIGVREEIERIEYYGLTDEEKFKLFYERAPFLAPERITEGPCLNS